MGALTTFNILLLGAIVFISSKQSIFNYRVWWQTEQTKTTLASATDLEKTQVEAAKELADTYAANEIAQFEQLIVGRYTYSDRPPRINWRRSVNPHVKTLIYDKHRRYVGYAYQGQFCFLRDNPDTCNTGGQQ